MADITINQTIRHFDHAVIMIDDGTNVATIDNWTDGSASLQEGGYERHDVDYVGSTMKTRRRQGKPMPSKLSVGVKRSDLFASTELRSMMNAVADADGYVPEITVTIKMYDSQAAATGEQIQLPNAIFMNKFNFSHGDQHDEVTIEIESQQPFATITEFTDP